jgi:hypothetical protein
MQITPLKILVLAVWVMAVGALGVVMPVTTTIGWVTIVGFGFLPATFMLRAWRRPTLTMTEIIQAQTAK